MNPPYRLRGLNLKSPRDLALRTGLSEELLERLANDPARYYRPERRVPKKSGGERIINEPSPLLKSVQQKINRLLQEVIIPTNFYGAVKGKSNVDNAAVHCNRKSVSCFDIENYFPSISFGRVKSLFIRLRCTPNIAIQLAKLTTVYGRVPQGTPTSSTLANLVLSQHERRFGILARQHGLRVTFFQDDLTFSGNMDTARLKNLVVRILSQIGFKTQERKLKTRRFNERQEVTGLIVNRKPNVPREYARNLRSAIHRVKNGTLTSPTDLESMKGKVRYVQRVNPTMGDKLWEDFQETLSAGRTSETS